MGSTAGQMEVIVGQGQEKQPVLAGQVVVGVALLGAGRGLL